MKTKLFTLPNVLTLLNLLCGSAAVMGMMLLPPVFALKLAFPLILASAAFDFLDGFAARLTGQYSKLGIQLDSLADVISFGLLPSLIAYNIYTITGGGMWLGLLTLLVVAFSALRLGKFNIDESQKTEFHGLPTPANALLIGCAGWVLASYIIGYNGIENRSLIMDGSGMPAAMLEMPQFPEFIQWTSLACTVFLAVLLISPIPMFSLKFNGFGFKHNAVRYIFLLAAFALIITSGLMGIGLSVVLYILISAALWLSCPAKRQRALTSGEK